MRSCRCKGLRSAGAIVVAIAAGGSARSLALSSAVPARPSDDKTILHVLNRTSFGPRPGDVDRVRSMGLENYIEQQLHPERIADTLHGTARLQGLRDVDDELARARSTTTSFRPARPRRGERRTATATANLPAKTPGKPEGHRPQIQARRKEREVVAELSRAEAPSRRLQRPTARRSDHRLLVQPLQRFAGKGATQLNYVSEYERDAIRPYVLGSSGTSRRDREKSGDAVLSG